MVFKLRIFLVLIVFAFQMDQLKSQIKLDDVSLVMIGNNTGYDKLSKSKMNQFFNGKYNRWPNNKNVLVVLPSSNHKMVELYSNVIYKKSFYSVKKYWFSLVFQGRFDPPHFFDSDQEIIDFVRINKGAFAVVHDSTGVPIELRIEIVN